MRGGTNSRTDGVALGGCEEPLVLSAVAALARDPDVSFGVRTATRERDHVIALGLVKGEMSSTDPANALVALVDRNVVRLLDNHSGTDRSRARLPQSAEQPPVRRSAEGAPQPDPTRLAVSDASDGPVRTAVELVECLDPVAPLAVLHALGRTDEAWGSDAVRRTPRHLVRRNACAAGRLAGIAGTVSAAAKEVLVGLRELAA